MTTEGDSYQYHANVTFTNYLVVVGILVLAIWAGVRCVLGLLFGAEASTIIAFAGLCFLSVLTAIIRIEWYTPFQILDDGIRFKSSLFGNKTVPWQDIVAIKRAYTLVPRIWIISVRHYSWLHHVLGVMLGLSSHCAIPVDGSIDRFEQAIARIQSEIDQRNS